MTDVLFARPAWQTDELEDEWIEPTDDEEVDNEHYNENHDDTFSSSSQGTRSISMTTPLAGILCVINTTDDLTDDHGEPTTTASQAGGTFLVREDVPAAPLLPQTPGRNNKKGMIKDFFSPLPLERMFEPPSPPPATIQTKPNQPAVSSRLAREYVPHLQESSTEVEDSEAGREKAVGTETAALDNRQFTFIAPRNNSQSAPDASNGLPQAQSTPLPPIGSNYAPMTDPRLKLFQFQYDTFTRDHLSAIVDSIAVNTPSGATPTQSNGSSFDRDQGNYSHLRSAKRVKLSPQSDYGEGDGAGASIARPKIYGKDYVGESRKMMEQIKSARDFSTISTVASAKAQEVEERNGADETQGRAQLLTVPATHPNPSSTPGSISNTSTTSSRLEKYSSLAYRKKGADLMAQIKSDMKGHRRIVSGSTDVTFNGRPDDKENEGPRERRGHRRASSSTSTTATRTGRQTQSFRMNVTAKQGPSPRKLLRRLSAADEVDRELAEEVRDMSIEDQGAVVPVITTANATAQDTIRMPRSPVPTNAQVGLLAPPIYPSNSVRSGSNEDLNRFVSSSTTTSGTTLTTGSSQSFVKHAGTGGNIRRIGPEDVQGMLGERVGRMVFDKVMMKWVKSVTVKTVETEEERTENTRASTESEDVFKDIESLIEDDSGGAQAQDAEGMSRITETEREEAEADDEEEMELNSFSFDGSAVVNVMTGVEDTEDLTTDSEDEDDRGLVTDMDRPEQDLGDGFDSDEDLPLPTSPYPPLVTPAFSTPLPSRSQTQMATTPVVRSVMKSTSNTPVSALKNGSGSRNRTPGNLSHRRSVSFSDGKRDGPIRGVGRNAVGASAGGGDERSAIFIPSARSKRIADMMEDLEDPDFEEEESPTRTSSSCRRSFEELQPLAVRKPAAGNNTSLSRRVFSRSQTHKPSPDHASRANATFLTECSFAVTHDRLVQIITDVEPFEPYWEEINSIDLSKKNVESVARLKEFLPKLDSLSLNSNQLSWLSGIPITVRTLSVSSNLLTGITSFSHLLNLENLDISHNDIDSLRQLDCLRHLRELRADGNKITSIDGLQKMDGLVKLSLQENCIRDVDLARYRWSRLEMLNMSRNRIDNIEGLASLPSLIALNLDNNVLGNLEPNGLMPRLRILRISGNRLYRLNVAPFPNVRTLYADNNALTGLMKADRLTKLENLSMRNQTGRGLNMPTRDIRDVKRLYLSGNPLPLGFLTEPCYNLLYLEFAACRLTTLPANFSSLVPNLRVLNLNYNFIEDDDVLCGALKGLGRLRKMTIVGGRVRGTKALLRVLKGMPEVEMVDFRMNPCTLGWYLPILVKDVPGALQPSEGGGCGEVGGGGSGGGCIGVAGQMEQSQARGATTETGRAWNWSELDAKFRRDLPDEAYVGRLAYRGLVMRACPKVRMLDGVEVVEKERVKAGKLLEGIVGRRRREGP